MDPSKRRFLKRSVVLLGASGLVTSGSKEVGAFEPPDVPPWMKSPGAGFNEYGVPSKHESKVTRTLIRSQPGTTGSGAARTPLEALDGTLTPSGLHFERSRSVPMAKAMDDAMLALFQNGERLRPENGYPVRLFLPGWEGNMSVKWLRRLKVVPAPIMTKDETSRYTDLQADGRSLMFTYPMEVKSVITRPSHGMTLKGAGLYQISGIAWSGGGTISRVEVTSDGGRTWTAAPLSPLVLPRALTRFRLPWRWDGGASVLKSRATDDTGAVQPERDRFIADHGNNAIFHCNAIQAWGVAANGEVKHVYA